MDDLAFKFVKRWDMNHRCTVRVKGHEVDVNHLYAPPRSKPYFAARIDGQEVCQPAASFPALLRRLNRTLPTTLARPVEGNACK